METGEYLEGEKHGLWVAYYANGNKIREGHYNRGKKDGYWVQYWENGNKKSEAFFSDGKYTGLYISYHSNGKRLYYGYYNEITGTSADGTKQGVWNVYAEDGETIVRKVTYHRGSRTKPDEYPPFEEKKTEK